jgi:predicted nucleotidyltransferase component of viral defense system
LATKLRALLQRDNPRDLVDLGHALDAFPELSAERAVDMFVQYKRGRSRGGRPKSTC